MTALLGSDILAVATGADTASAAATLAHDGKNIMYVDGFEITGLGATALTNVVATLAGLVGGKTLSYEFSFPAGATVLASPLIVNFTRPIPAQDVNTDIVLTVPGAAGNTSLNINLRGHLG